MRDYRLPVAIGAVLIMAAVLLAIVSLRSPGTGAVSGALTPDPGMESLSIPAFTFTNQSGDTVDESILSPGDRLTVVDFIFTHCPFVCPPMGRNMRTAQQRLAGLPVQFVSVSVDPERDTPERLADYAQEIGADPTNWTFLTGDRDSIQRILRDGLMLAGLQDDPDNMIPLPEGGEMANIQHPSHFILLDPDGNVLGLYGGTNETQVEMLIERVRAAAPALVAN